MGGGGEDRLVSLAAALGLPSLPLDWEPRGRKDAEGLISALRVSHTLPDPLCSEVPGGWARWPQLQEGLTSGGRTDGRPWEGTESAALPPSCGATAIATGPVGAQPLPGHPKPWARCPCLSHGL